MNWEAPFTTSRLPGFEPTDSSWQFSYRTRRWPNVEKSWETFILWTYRLLNEIDAGDGVMKIGRGDTLSLSSEAEYRAKVETVIMLMKNIRILNKALELVLHVYPSRCMFPRVLLQRLKDEWKEDAPRAYILMILLFTTAPAEELWVDFVSWQHLALSERILCERITPLSQ